jgi:hypothetical protein
MGSVKLVTFIIVLMTLLSSIKSSTTRDANELCGLWCNNPASDQAWVECIQNCLTTLK